MENLIEKSEILFLFESKYTIPNGDPFTGEQRYDDESKNILVSDVRIKRYVRDYFEQNGKEIYVSNPNLDEKLTAGQRFKMLFEKRNQKEITARQFALSLIDVRLFGAVIPIQKEKGKKKDETGVEDSEAFNITGAVQFAMLNPSLNKVDIRIHQNTSVFISKEGNSQGAIGTTSVVPYAINQIHGWVNPYSALNSKLTNEDVNELFLAMWNSVNNVNTRSKSNQNSVLLIQIVYNNPNDKLYGTDKLISIESAKEDEQIRDSNDYSFVFTKLNDILKSEKVKEMRYYTELSSIENALVELKSPKLKKLSIFNS